MPEDTDFSCKLYVQKVKHVALKLINLAPNMDEWRVLVKMKIDLWGSAKVLQYLKQLS